MTSKEIFAQIAEGQLDKSTALELLQGNKTEQSRIAAVREEAGSVHERVERYLLERLAASLEVPESEIDIEVNLMELGLDSTRLVQLAEQFERELNITLYPTVFFEHQTLQAVIEYFAEEHASAFTQQDSAPASEAASPAPSPAEETVPAEPQDNADASPPAEEISGDDAAALSTRVLDYLIASLAKTLEVPDVEIDVEANLMDLGLDSTKLVRLAEQFENELGITLYPTVFFEHQTLEAVAEYFAEEHGEAFSAETTQQQAAEAKAAQSDESDSGETRANPPQAPAPIESTWPENACRYHYVWQHREAPAQSGDQRPGAVCLHIEDVALRETFCADDFSRRSPCFLLENEMVVDTQSAERFSLQAQSDFFTRHTGPLRVIFCVASGSAEADPSRNTALAALELLRKVGSKTPLQLIFAVENDDDRGAAAHAALASLAATIRVEYPLVNTATVLFDTHDHAATLLACAFSNGEVLSVTANQWHQRVVAPLIGSESDVQPPLREGGVYLLTGATGGLGATFAEDLAARYSARLVLSGRRAEDEQIRAMIKRIEAAGGAARYVDGDIADRHTAERMVTMALDAFGPINGVIHAAGLLNDGAITRKSDTDFIQVSAPKVLGLQHLDQLTAQEPLDLFVAFSSVAAVTGNHGQADYSYANGFMDGLLETRSQQEKAGLRAGRSLSIQWPLWEAGGMRPQQNAIEFMQSQLGLSLLSNDTGISAFYRALNLDTCSLLYLEGDRARIEGWLKPSPKAEPQQTGSAKQPAVAVDTEFGASSQRTTNHAVSEDDIAIIGYHGEFPGSPTPEDFWRNLLEGKDLISSDQQRWEFDGLAEFLGIDNESQETFVGGFMQDYAAFDPGFFKLSASEAEIMDPQQRRFLQVAWSAIEAAGYDPQSLEGSRTGVFVGASTRDYQDRAVILGCMHQAETNMLNPQTSTGMALNNIPNRLSFYLDLKGPSEAIDTACSSSLVALHRAVLGIQRGDCELAIAGGVNLMLSPTPFWAFLSTGILSSDSRCRSFSDRANGYVRGEGVGAVLLKSRAAAERDGDCIHAIVKGSAVNHGGRVQSLTAPNPRQQADVIAQAIQRAGVSPDAIGYIEAHGTGTALGDPVEIQGLKRAFDACGIREKEPRCGIGTVKSNIGHLEAAAGIAGLIKALLCLRHGILPQSLHIDNPNPYLDMKESPFYLLREKRQWTRFKDDENREMPRCAGVSSFGFGGTNAHVILEEYPAKVSAAKVAPALLLLSAHSPERLRESAARLHNHLADAVNSGTAVDLEAIAYTLQVGRSSFREKLALVTDSPAEAIAILSAFTNGKSHRKLMTGSSVGINELAEALQQPYSVDFLRGLFSDGRLDALARLWLSGIPVDWQCVNPLKRRVPLPTYPFANTPYWLGGQAQAPAERPAEGRLKDLKANAELTTANSASQQLKPMAQGTSEVQATGKVDKASDVHRLLKTEVAQLLKLEADQIAGDKPLTNYGLDSILGMSLVNSIKRELDMPIYVSEIMQHDTLNKLADYLSAEIAARTPSENRQPSANRAPEAKPSDQVGFILSTPRAGSTLLRTMLQGHDQLFAPPELHLLGFENLSERQDALDKSGLEEGLIEAIKTLRDCSAEDARREVQRLTRDKADIQQVYAYLQELAAPAQLIDKSPTYGRDPALLQQGARLFPEARYLFLVRDPRAVMESIVRNRFDRLIAPESDNPWEVAQGIWLQINRNIREFLSAIPDHRRLIVRYEDLVREPRRQTSRICEFLGVNATPEMLNPYGASRMVDGLHTGSLSIGDPNFLQHEGIDKACAESWKNKLPDEFSLSEETIETAAALGYWLEPGYPLSPAQSQSLARAEDESEWHLVQRFAVGESIKLDAAYLRERLTQVITSHPQLAVTLSADKNRFNAAPASELVITMEAENTSSEELERQLAQQLSATEGPIVAAALTMDDDARRTISVIWHHLFIDGLSAMQLYEEIVASCCDTHREPGNGGTTAGYEDYLQALSQAIVSPAAAPEWISAYDGEQSGIPDAAPETDNRFADQREEFLNASTLLEVGEEQAVYGYFEYLATALVRVIANWSERDSAVIALRLHGRDLGEEGVFPDVVGNLACDVPIKLSQTQADTMLHRFTDAYEGIGRSGVDYELLRRRGDVPAPWELASVRFNYQPFGYCAQSYNGTNEQLGDDGQRRYLLDFIARQQGERLLLILRYNHHHHDCATVRRLLREWLETASQLRANPIPSLDADKQSS